MYIKLGGGVVSNKPNVRSPISNEVIKAIIGELETELFELETRLEML